MKILFKFTSRNRPNKFFDTINNILTNLYSAKEEDYIILCSLDYDDETMNNPMVHQKIKDIQQYNNIQVEWGYSKSKIDAINRDVNKVKDWDILINVSDDMVFQFYGFDTFIRSVFKENYPDLDGCPCFWDGYVQSEFITLSVLGRKFYDRFGYIYHPEYKNVYCDNEQTDVAKMLGKFIFIKDPLMVKHEHPANNTNIQRDAQYQTQDSTESHIADQNVYNKRKSSNFNL
jgi:hypothetical protein